MACPLRKMTLYFRLAQPDERERAKTSRTKNFVIAGPMVQSVETDCKPGDYKAKRTYDFNDLKSGASGGLNCPF